MARKVSQDLDEEEDFQPAKRFRIARTSEEENDLLQNAIPLSTRYTNKWAFKLFEAWRLARDGKLVANEESSCDMNLEQIQNLDVDIVQMSPESLNFWLSKFVQEVTGMEGQRYPATTLYQIVTGLKRYLEERGRDDVNFMNKSLSA